MTLASSKTTLILGAGASRPYGFPTAAELREILVFQKPDKVDAILRSLGLPASLQDVAHRFLVDNHGHELVNRFQRELFWAQTESIDEFAQKREGQYDSIARRAMPRSFFNAKHRRIWMATGIASSGVSFSKTIQSSQLDAFRS